MRHRIRNKLSPVETTSGRETKTKGLARNTDVTTGLPGSREQLSGMPVLIPEKSRELFPSTPPLVCPAGVQVRATFKIRLCPSQHSGCSEILRGRVKPVQLRIPDETARSPSLFLTVPLISRSDGNDHDTNNEGGASGVRATADRALIVRGIFVGAFPKFLGRKIRGKWNRIPFYPRGNADSSCAGRSFRHGETRASRGNPSSGEVANGMADDAANFRNIK